MRIASAYDRVAIWHIAIHEPPPDLTFKHWPDDDSMRAHFGGVPFAAPAVTAHLPDGMIGKIEWYPEDSSFHGEVRDIRIHPKYHRQGIGTALYRHVKQNIEPMLHHSDDQSAQGTAWAKEVGE